MARGIHDSATAVKDDDPFEDEKPKEEETDLWNSTSSPFN